MSGFCGILSTAGRQVSAALLEPLVRSLEFRGPDGTGVWARGPIGLGHTLLRTGLQHPREQQPVTLDGNVWIVGDMRIDARAELVAGLRSRGRCLPDDATDAELVLHAFAAWGESCPERLLGDFAFAVWDAPKRKLFCARDQMGVKPFFYSRTSETFLFGNTLECLRLHPDVPADLDELAIADFLMFGYSLDVASSAFAAIRRLSPAHVLTVVGNRLRTRRYWTLPIDEPVYFRRAADYVEQFRELLASSVRDRFRSDRVAVFMSGGLDSTLLTAEAKAQSNGKEAVFAFTYVYDHLVADDERLYAGLAASHLDIPIRFWQQDAKSAFEPTSRPPVFPPEPIAEPDAYGIEVGRYREMAECARSAFYGEGPDNALHYEWRPHLTYLWRAGRWGRMLRDIMSHIVAHRRVPLLPTIPRMLRARRERKEWDVPFPAWLNPDLVRRFDLRGRWEQGAARPAAGADAPHPVRPTGYRSMHLALWPSLLESLDAGWTRAALSVCHPYLDLRMLRFLLAVPAMPWCRRKLLLRSAASGRLPKAITARAKTPLRADPEFVRSRGRVPLPSPAQAALLERFVASAVTVPPFASTASLFRANSRPNELAVWLQNRAF